MSTATAGLQKKFRDIMNKFELLQKHEGRQVAEKCGTAVQDDENGEFTLVMQKNFNYPSLRQAVQWWQY